MPSARPKKPSESLAALRRRLQEAEETIQAIRSGQVEALLVDSPEGPKVFTLEGADHRYRRLVETMNEGALLVNAAGLIMYSNSAFAKLVSTPLETVMGRLLFEFVDPASWTAFEALLAMGLTQPVAEEVTLRGEHGLPVAAFLSLSPNEGGELGASVIVTNLTTQKRNEQIVASERLASSILEQAAEAIVVCDRDGLVIRVSNAARELSVVTPLRRHVLDAFPLRAGGNITHPALRALNGHLVRSLEMTLNVMTGDPLHLLCTAAPLLNERHEVLGCVMSLANITPQKLAEQERLELLGAEQAARAAAERARREAEASNRSKDDFLATVSHELRTPLNSIVGWSRLLAGGTLPEDRQRHAIDVIRRNADAQARLVEDLLDVSRIITGQLPLDVQTVQLERVIGTVMDSVKPALDAKQLRLDLSVEAEDTNVTGDETRLQQIIWNLVSNATKFTPAQGRISLVVRSDGTALVVTVTDDGEGIKPEFLPYVFDRFRQADAGIDRLRGGLGLGLAISRHLVELHGGTIEVKSDGPGTGTTFTLRLPRARRTESASFELPVPPSRQANGELSELSDLSGLHVLLLEDDADSRDLCAAILTKCGARVTCTDSGHEALALFTSLLPDVVVSDIGMPIMDGYTFIQSLRALSVPSAGRVPAVALTAYAREEDETRALSAGFQHHVSKPLDPAKLTALVASLGRAQSSSP